MRPLKHIKMYILPFFFDPSPKIIKFDRMDLLMYMVNSNIYMVCCLNLSFTPLMLTFFVTALVENRRRFICRTDLNHHEISLFMFTLGTSNYLKSQSSIVFFFSFFLMSQFTFCGINILPSVCTTQHIINFFSF